MAKKFKSNLGSKRKTQSKVSAERVQWETRNRFNPIRNLSPASLSSYMDAWERGEIGTLARVWDVMARRDLRLSGLIPKRLKKPARRDWNIVMLEDTPESERQRDAVEHAFNHAMLKSAVDGDKCEGFAGIIRSMMQAVGMKYAVHELIWQPSPEGLTFEAVEVPLWFFERKSGKLRFLAQPHAQTGEDLEPGEWMTTVADGLMESSGVAYMFKSLPLKDILAYCDKFGVPGLVAKTDASPDTKEWEAVHEMVASFGSEMAAVVSRNGTELDFPTVKGGAGTTPMEALVDYIDRAMSSVWHGSDLSTMSRDNDAVGSLAQNAEADTLELDDCERISDTINKQLIGSILKYALGTDAILVKFELDVSDLEATGDELTVDKGLYEMGFKHSVNDIAERYGRKVPEDGEETLSKDKGESEKEKAALALANIAGGDHHRNQSRDNKGRFGSMSAVGMYSDVVHEAFENEDDVFKRHQSDKQKQLKASADLIDKKNGVASTQYDSFGDWGTGFESSVLTEFYGTQDSELLEYLMARRGAENGQMGTALFELDENGEDIMFEVNGFKTVSEARKLMDAHGLEFRTISNTASGDWSVRILTNEADKDIDKFEAVANAVSNERVAFYSGKFSQIGDWDFENGSHDRGVKMQQQIVDSYEKRNKTKTEEISEQDRRSKKQRPDSDGPGGSLANSRRVGQANQKGLKGWLVKYFGNKRMNSASATETADTAVEHAQLAIQKDFEPMAASLATALNEKDPALKKALLLKIAAADVPASDALTTALTKAMAAEVIEGFSDVE